MFFNLCWIWSKKASISSFYKESNFKPCLTKQLLNMFKLWCERGISYGVCRLRARVQLKTLSSLLKAAKYDIQQALTRATLFLCKFRVFHLAWATSRATIFFAPGWRKLLRKVERVSTLSNKSWLCCSFSIKLATCLGSTPSKSTNQIPAFLEPNICCATR